MEIIIWSKKQVGATVSAVQEIIETFSADLPNGLEIITWDDWSKYYDQHMAMLTGNAIVGFMLVFIILALTLHLRLALWVSGGVLIAVSGAFRLMPMLEFLSIPIVAVYLCAGAVGARYQRVGYAGRRLLSACRDQISSWHGV